MEALERRGVRVEEAYVFGSRVRGDALETSDVDAVIVSGSFRGMRFTERLDLVYRVEWEESIEPWVEVIPLTPEELEERLRLSAVLRDASRYWLRVRPGGGGGER
ncbi:MAG: nucleotidyltransferase domain-containing protein [Crenarchaeota archaeon]|nr:nucleotidyltransferase domain-containing protein [Thermoproteota archaeon]